MEVWLSRKLMKSKKVSVFVYRMWPKRWRSGLHDVGGEMA